MSVIADMLGPQKSDNLLEKFEVGFKLRIT